MKAVNARRRRVSYGQEKKDRLDWVVEGTENQKFWSSSSYSSF